MTRLGIFGGTFDPPHNGHLLAATDAAEALGLDRVWFVPNATQPLKGPGYGSPADRLAMVRLLVGPDSRFGVDALEIERDGLSYTVDTVAAFAARYPDASRFLLVGADVKATFSNWREPRRIMQLAELVILQRAPDIRDDEADAGTRDVADPYLDGVRRLHTRRVDMSSTEIRDRVRTGKPIRGFVPDAVAEYIAAAGLYR